MFTHSRRARPAPRRGSTLPMVVILLVLLVGMVSFAVDTGYVAYARTDLQRSADMGAAAAIAKLYEGGTQAQARTEARTYIQLNETSSFSVPDADIEFGLYDPTAAAGSRYTTTLNGNTPNAVRVTLRRDGSTNPKLDLFFAPVIGRNQNAVQVRATSWLSPGLGAKAGAELIPYTLQVDFFNAGAGLPARPSNSPGFRNVDASGFPDTYTPGPVGTTPTAVPDGIKEIVLFDSGANNTPGNWGSLDLGTASNGTQELIRQLLNGPNASDLAVLQQNGKLAADGSLQTPVSLGGDPGISNATKTAWDQIIGQNKIIPLYDTVTGNGNNTVYSIVGFAGVRILSADLQGNPKRVVVQPTTFYSRSVTALPPGGTGGMYGVYTPPRVVMP